MFNIKYIPVPYLIFDRSLKVIETSEDADQIFPPSLTVEDLIDEGSRNKFKHLLEGNERQECELVLKTEEVPMALFDCSFQWRDDACHMICIRKNSDIERLEELVKQHSKRLANTNFELLENKESLENSIMKIKRLSAPFIKISKTTGVVMLFGELDKSLIEVNQNVLSERAFKGEYEQILFDFNGIGEFEEGGIEAFCYLLQRLQVMGIDSSVIGLKPNQAFHFNRQGKELQASFKTNLHDVIHTYLSS
ncbi:hypothetical protein AB3N04_16590 [Alkalihalophilus sp. As8PL]|uniref:STAS domain-containing protein n=1 Tax=Alkalihalophilus sp. As8PL TaxID=3237103 RepID=A0AB39BR71_9BACI